LDQEALVHAAQQCRARSPVHAGGNCADRQTRALACAVELLQAWHESHETTASNTGLCHSPLGKFQRIDETLYPRLSRCGTLFTNGSSRIVVGGSPSQPRDAPLMRVPVLCALALPHRTGVFASRPWLRSSDSSGSTCTRSTPPRRPHRRLCNCSRRSVCRLGARLLWGAFNTSWLWSRHVNASFARADECVLRERSVYSPAASGAFTTRESMSGQTFEFESTDVCFGTLARRHALVHAAARRARHLGHAARPQGKCKCAVL